LEETSETSLAKRTTPAIEVIKGITAIKDTKEIKTTNEINLAVRFILSGHL